MTNEGVEDSGEEVETYSTSNGPVFCDEDIDESEREVELTPVYAIGLSQNKDIISLYRHYRDEGILDET